MRIVIDMQGAQSESRFRGIGRYTMALSQAIVHNRRKHDIILSLNGLFPDTIEPIRAAFHDLLPQERIRIWEAPGPVRHICAPMWRRRVAEYIREHFIAQTLPDMVLVTSLFEGFGDDSVTSIREAPCGIPTAVILYDLIPYIHRSSYLEHPVYAEWYLNKFDHLRRADLLLSISESSRQDAIRYLPCDERAVINISSAVDTQFAPRNIPASRERKLREAFGLTRPFVMYTGGIDYRKNIERLIRAYAAIPLNIRRHHQLAIVCRMEKHDRRRFFKLAEQNGLRNSDLVITGFVSDDELIDLYNLCKVFVLPSLHEGFGLPALEAMSCGAPVIASDASSLPEVIGRKDALFDPENEQEITARLVRTLTEHEFRLDLARWGVARARRFSWSAVAKRTLDVFERWHDERITQRMTITYRRPKLAYISPLPRERAGISQYSDEFLSALGRHFDIHLILAQEDVTNLTTEPAFPIRTVDWFRRHADRYDRVLYDFRHSNLHMHMVPLLQEIPGVVFLHDFFLSSVKELAEVCGLSPNAWSSALYLSQGYEAVRQCFHATKIDVVMHHPCNVNALPHAKGMIVHSDNCNYLGNKWYEDDIARCAVVPFPRAVTNAADKEAARTALGFCASDFLVVTFYHREAATLNQRLFEAWLKSTFANDRTCHLVFAAPRGIDTYDREFAAIIRSSFPHHNIRIIDGLDTDRYLQCLTAADIGIQLRGREAAGLALDCMSRGLATVVNDNLSIPDLYNDAVWRLPVDFSEVHIVEAIETLRRDTDLREKLGRRGREVVSEHHNPSMCAVQHYEAIERFYASSQNGTRPLASAIAGIGHEFEDNELIDISQAIALSMPRPMRQRQLLLDVSETCRIGITTGIQRTARALTLAFLEHPPQGFRVEPVYLSNSSGTWCYMYGRRFTLGLMACPPDVLADDVVEIHAGDVLLVLDLSCACIDAKAAGLFSDYRRRGVAIYFVIHDLLPLRLPEHFPPELAIVHENRVRAALEADGALCISRSVADDLLDWAPTHNPSRERPLRIGWFHLGADLSKTAPTIGLPEEARQHLAALGARPSFLMVGTIEPRKGYLQTLDAFDQLWNEGLDVNLTIVGINGWLNAQLLARLQSRSAHGERLFWINACSDEYLEKIYAASSCLIAASEGEGFGLPLIEAARHRLPIIARDLPVFREVAGEHAFYFASKEPRALAVAIKEWLALYDKGRHPTSDPMTWLTWSQSARRIEDIILRGDWYHSSTEKARQAYPQETEYAHDAIV